MRDLTPLLNVLAAFQLKATRLQRIANYSGIDPVRYDLAFDTYPLLQRATARVDYLAAFIRSLI